MIYPDEYEYEPLIMRVMENAMKYYWKTRFKSVTFYKASNSKNYRGKIDGQVCLLLTNEYHLNLQIKRSDKYINTFSIGGNAMRSYLENDYDIEALLIGTAYDRNMYLVYWSEFLELAAENLHKWKSPNGDYYVIRLEYLSPLYMEKVPYLEEDYKILQNYWDDK